MKENLNEKEQKIVDILFNANLNELKEKDEPIAIFEDEYIDLSEFVNEIGLSDDERIALILKCNDPEWNDVFAKYLVEEPQDYSPVNILFGLTGNMENDDKRIECIDKFISGELKGFGYETDIAVFAASDIKDESKKCNKFIELINSRIFEESEEWYRNQGLADFSMDNFKKLLNEVEGPDDYLDDIFLEHLMGEFTDNIEDDKITPDMYEKMKLLEEYSQDLYKRTDGEFGYQNAIYGIYNRVNGKKADKLFKILKDEDILKLQKAQEEENEKLEKENASLIDEFQELNARDIAIEAIKADMKKREHLEKQNIILKYDIEKAKAKTNEEK